MLKNNDNTNKQNGFTLIEVMVALVIFSIGLLGLAGIQQVSLSQNATSMQRTVAMNFAYDMLDRMRNNKSTNYTTATAASSPNCVSAPCNATQMANYDIYEWNLDLAYTKNLPNGRGFITGGPTGYTIYVGWDENKKGSVPTSCNPPTPADIQCIAIQGRP